MSLKFFFAAPATTGSGVSFPDQASIQVQQITVMCWVSTLLANNNNAANMCWKDAPAALDNTWSFWLNSTGHSLMPSVSLGHATPGVDDTFNPVGSIPIDGTWHHIAWTYDPTNAGANAGAFYIDGVFDSNFSELAAFTFLYQNGNMIYGFQTGTSTQTVPIEPFSGFIADERLYNRALSAGEINEIFRGFGADRIINGMVTKCQLAEGSSGVNATVANSIIDFSPSLLKGTPLNAGGASVFPQYAVHPIKTKRRRTA